MALEEEPGLRVGINFSLGFLPWLPQARKLASCLEMPAAPFYAGSRRMLESLRNDWEMVITGGNLNLGSSRELDLERLRAYAVVVEESRAAWLTEPLGVQEVQGRRYPFSLPPRADRIMAAQIADKAKAVMDRCQRPLLLKVPNGMLMVGSVAEEVAFLNRICKESGCGLAIDLDALMRMSRSHLFSAKEWLAGIEAEYIQQLDVPGASFAGEDWKLLRWVKERTRPRAVFVQWTRDYRGVPEIEAAFERLLEFRREAA